MPFKSKAQLRTCYGTAGFGSSEGVRLCDRWLKETQLSVECLPEKSGEPVKCRRLRRGERVRSALKTGPRGGRYFIIREKNTSGKTVTVKVYVPRR